MSKTDPDDQNNGKGGLPGWASRLLLPLRYVWLLIQVFIYFNDR